MPDLNDNCCFSGGADGSDLAWGTAAAAMGHGVVHFTFEGHRSKAPRSTIRRLSNAELREADDPCKRANEIVQRRYPPQSQFVRRLLQRNWYQVQYTNALYAISSFDQGKVAGGTAWAVAMFINRFNGTACPAYVFDQENCHWFVWDGMWKPIYEPPKPTGWWTGIGSRKVNFVGRLAINVLTQSGPHIKTIWD